MAKKLRDVAPKSNKQKVSGGERHKVNIPQYKEGELKATYFSDPKPNIDPPPVHQWGNPGSSY